MDSRIPPMIPWAIGARVSAPGPSPMALEFNRQLDRSVDGGHLKLAEFRDPRTQSWKGKLSPDHFHPNDLGYSGMAEIMADAIARR